MTPKFIFMLSGGTCNYPVGVTSPDNPNEASACGKEASLLAVWNYGDERAESMNLCWKHARVVAKHERNKK